MIILYRFLSICQVTDNSIKLLSILYWILSCEYLKCINVLFKYKLSLLNTNYNRLILAITIQEGFIKACKVLLNINNINLNYFDLRILPSLILAAAHNYTEILIRLLQYKYIDIN